ncbi:MAG: SAM-dependent chlorinase/fluorinase [Candidatus Bathyarchaeota archaeon]
MGEGEKRRGAHIITFTTDFGIKDAYVSEMKGVILGICPGVTFVDISHDIGKHNVLEGAFILSQASPCFPMNTIHLAIVDPGVGTARRRIIIQGRHNFYIGPDNGVLSLAAKNEEVVKIVEIRNEKFMRVPPAKTFEGRDIFAPVAAYLSKGVPISEFGPEIDDFVVLTIPEATKKDKTIQGKIINIDSFGNITTNISEDKLQEVFTRSMQKARVTVGRVSKKCLFSITYGETNKESPLLTIGSSRYLEIAVNQGSAKRLFKAKVGKKVIILPL